MTSYAKDDPRALAVAQLRDILFSSGEQSLIESFEVMVAGQPDASLDRFLKAREYNVDEAKKMLFACLKWREKHNVDTILSRPIEGEKFNQIRATQLYGMTGFDYQGRPVMVVRLGLSSYSSNIKLEEYVHSHIQHNEYRDRVILPEASRRAGRPITKCIKIYDMAGLKITHLNRVKMQRPLATVDDLNYPEKSEVYYIVNAPKVFNTCWKTVQPMLPKRTRNKIKVLRGSGRDELLKVMDEETLPHFVRYAPIDGLQNWKAIEALNARPELADKTSDSCHPCHPYHVEMQRYIIQERVTAKLQNLQRDTSSREVTVDDVLEACGGEEEEREMEEVVSHVVEEALKSGELEERSKEDMD